MDFSHEKQFTAKKAGGIGVVVLAHAVLAGALIYGLHSTFIPHQNETPIELKLPTPTAKPIELPTLPPSTQAQQHVIIDVPVPPSVPVSPFRAEQVIVDHGPIIETGGGLGTGVPTGGEGSKPVTHTSTPVKVDFDTCKPSYTRGQIANEEEGTVRLKMEIGADSRLVSASVIKSSGFADLDKSTVAALSKCSFKAATQDGSPVQSTLVTDYFWSLDR